MAGAVVCNSLDVGLASGALTVVAVVALVFAIVLNSKRNKEYLAKVAVFDKELDEIDEKVDAVYATDSRIALTEKEIERAEAELEKLRSEYSDIEIIERLGENNLIVYCSFAGIADKCFVVVDGNERGNMTKNLGMFFLDPGEHNFYMTIFSHGDVFDTADVNFTVDGNNKYVYIEHDFRTYEHETKTYDSFDAFAANFRDTKWVIERLLQSVEEN